MIIHRLLCSLLLVLMTGVAGPAAAEGDVRSVLVFGPGGRTTDGRIAAGYVQERLSPKDRPDERVGTTGLPFADDEYRLTGAGQAQWCVPGAPAVGDVQETIGRAREALDMLESSRVVEIVDRFEAGAACLDTVLPAGDVAELFLLRGLAHHVDGSESLARADFARAAGIDPSLEWNTGYPPDPQQAYLLAREETSKAKPYRFGWSFSLTEDAEVFVDGVPLGRIALHDLAPVPHLLQVRDSSGLTSAFLRTEPGGTGVLVDRAGAITAVMTGPTDDLSRTIAAAVLDQVAVQWSAQRIVVVNTTWRPVEKEPLVYRYDSKTGYFETLTAMQAIRRHVPRFTDKVRISAGAGLALEGRAGDESFSGTYLAFSPGGTLQVRIGPGFTPGAGFDLLWMRKLADGIGKFVVVPQARGSFGYRWRPRNVQTYIGALILVRFDRIPGELVVLPGIGIEANVDIVPRTIHPLFIRVGGDAGVFTGIAYIRMGVRLGLKL